MGFLNRFFLMLSMLVMMAAALAVLSVCLHILPEHYWLNEVHYAISRPETIAIAVVVLLVSLNLFFASFSRQVPKERSSGEFVIVSGASGDVRVSIAAVRDLLKKLVRDIRGVRDAHVHVMAARDAKAAHPLRVEISLAIGQETNVSVVSEMATARVQEQLKELLGFQDVPVAVDIADISNVAPPDRKRRVV